MKMTFRWFGPETSAACLRRVRWCNGAATRAGRTRTEQKNDAARTAIIRLDKRIFRQGVPTWKALT